MKEYQGKIRKVCPYNYVPTVKMAAANFISYNVAEAREASGEMMEIIEQLRDRILSVNPQSIKYNIEDFSLIGKISYEHDNYYPQSIDDVIPLDINKNAEFLYKKVRENQHPFIQEIIEAHDGYYDSLGSHVKSSRKVMTKITRKSKNERIQGLNAGDVLSLFDYQSIQERAETSEPIAKFNTIIANRGDIINEILKMQSQVCHVIQEMVNDNQQLKHEEIAYSEFGFMHQDRIVPNSRFLKVVTNNYGPYFHKYESENAKTILSKSSKDAEDDKMLAQKLFLFEENREFFDLVGVDNRACPAINTIGPIVRHLAM